MGPTQHKDILYKKCNNLNPEKIVKNVIHTKKQTQDPDQNFSNDLNPDPFTKIKSDPTRRKTGLTVNDLLFVFSLKINKNKQEVLMGGSRVLQCLSDTVCPGSLDPLYIESYYVSWVRTSWTYSNEINLSSQRLSIEKNKYLI